MQRVLKIFSVLAALCFVCETASAQSAQAVATQFVSPVGAGYNIAQGFNTPRNYIANNADSAWCADNGFCPVFRETQSGTRTRDRM